MEQQIHPALYLTRDYLYMLGLKLIQKKDPTPPLPNTQYMNVY